MLDQMRDRVEKLYCLEHPFKEVSIDKFEFIKKYRDTFNIDSTISHFSIPLNQFPEYDKAVVEYYNNEESMIVYPFMFWILRGVATIDTFSIWIEFNTGRWSTPLAPDREEDNTPSGKLLVTKKSESYWLDYLKERTIKILKSKQGFLQYQFMVKTEDSLLGLDITTQGTKQEVFEGSTLDKREVKKLIKEFWNV